MSHLRHPIFLLALLLLLLNDHYLKWTYHNAITGKLSDLAGLLLLPLLLAYLWPRRAMWMPFLSGLFFLWWKSPLATATINWYNQWTPLPITRVIDYTDYWALLVLPLVYHFLLHQRHSAYYSFAPRTKRLLNLGIALSTFMAFTATSPPPYFYYNLRYAELPFYSERYKVRHSPSSIRDQWANMGYHFQPDSALIDSLSKTDYRYFYRIEDPYAAFFLLPELPLLHDTIRQLRLALVPLTDRRTMILFNGMALPRPLPSSQSTEELRKHYGKALKKALIRPL